MERRSFEEFFVSADEVVRPVLEADADVRPEVSVDEIEAAMREGGSIGGGAGGGSANGSLRVEVRASRRAPQPPKAGVNGSATAETKQANGNAEQPKSPTSDGEKRRRRKDEPAEGEIDVRAVMPQSTFKFRRAVRPEETLEEKEKEKLNLKELPPLGREETL